MKTLAVVMALTWCARARAADADDPRRAAIAEAALRAMAETDFAWALYELELAQQSPPSELDALLASAYEHLQRTEEAIHEYKQVIAPTQPATANGNYPPPHIVHAQLTFLKWVLITFGALAGAGLTAVLISMAIDAKNPTVKSQALRLGTPQPPRAPPTQPLAGLALVKLRF